MKQLRPLVIGLPVLLAGCSSLPSVSWSSLSPFHWFGESRQVDDRGVGDITAATPMTEAALDKALNGDYRLRKGMETRNGAIVTFFQALDDDQVKLTIYGQSPGRVERVVVVDSDIASTWGVKIGTPFSTLYSKAFNVCQKGSGEEQDLVVCKAPQSAHVSYAFKGIWHGPEGLMPADDQLKSWRVSKIIWQSAVTQSPSL